MSARLPVPPSEEGATAGQVPIRCAGMARRLAATLVDMVLLCGLCALLAWPVARSIDWRALPSNLDEVAAAVSDPSWLGHAAGIVGMWVALWWSYFVVGWGLIGATPGKWLLGLRIVDHRGRCPIGVARALLRLSAYGVSSLTLGLGHLAVLVRRDHCALHDLLAGTRVVRSTTLRRETNPDPTPPL